MLSSSYDYVTQVIIPGIERRRKEMPDWEFTYVYHDNCLNGSREDEGNEEAFGADKFTKYAGKPCWDHVIDPNSDDVKQCA